MFRPKFENFEISDIFSKKNSNFFGFFFREKNRDIENRLHKPLSNAYEQLRNQKKLGLAQPQSILVGFLKT